MRLLVLFVAGLLPSWPLAADPLGHPPIQLPDLIDERMLQLIGSGAISHRPDDSFRSESALVEAGRSIFVENCEPCHGATATEGGAGDIRGMGRSSVVRATHGIEQMPQFDLANGDIDAIVAYLDFLNRP